MTRFIYFAVVVFCGGGGLLAEPRMGDYLVDRWAGEDGLPAKVQALAIDSDGFLWAGTDDGLARFDGVAWRVFRKAEHPELGDNDVMSLAADREGRRRADEEMIMYAGCDRRLVHACAGERRRIRCHPVPSVAAR